MTVLVSFRFLAGSYHATPWQLPANAGEVEWPPSPWRIARALISTWHTRLPHLDASAVQHLMTSLATEPPRYLLPSASRSQTRHYLPQLAHDGLRSGETVLTLDARLHVSPQEELIVCWPSVTLDQAQTATLAALVEALPYLGRAESSCEGRLLDADTALGVSDGAWTVVEEGGDRVVLGLSPDVTLEQLEATPDRIRRERLAWPRGTEWLTYREGVRSEAAGASAGHAMVTAAVWEMRSTTPTRMTHGILATTGLRGRVIGPKQERIDGNDAWRLTGHGAPNEGHEHAHWLFLPSTARPDVVGRLALWCPAGIPAELLSFVTRVRSLPDPRLQSKTPGDAYVPDGYVPGGLQLTGLGRAEDLLPGLCGASTRWASRTPITTPRFPKKNQDAAEFWRSVVQRELDLRPQLGGAQVVKLSVRLDRDEGVRRYRRYRWSETMRDRRRGAFVEITLDRPVEGPLVLGALAHFGLGVMEPLRDGQH